MKHQLLSLALWGLATLATLGGAATGNTLCAQDLCVHAERLHTMRPDADNADGYAAPILDAVVIIREGQITSVGPASEVPIPEDLTVVRAAVVTPGLIDAHSVVGLAGWLNVEHDQDQLDNGAALQPELRAIDAYNPREPLIAWLRSFGITTVHTGHAPGQVISGQTLIAQTRGETVEEAVFVPMAMLAANLGETALSTEGSGNSKPGTRAKAVALLRQQLIKAQDYQAKLRQAEASGEDSEGSKAPTRNLGLEVLVEVLERRLPLLVTAHRTQDLRTALRIAEEFDLRVVLDGASEAYLLLEALQSSQTSVLLHPPMMRATGERKHATMASAALLREAGIQTALQSGFEGYVPKTRVVLFEAAQAARHGLPFQAALGLITQSAAELLGIEDRVGSVEVGKHGDLALFDSDPFEYTSHCVGTIIEGEVVSTEKR